MKNQIKIALALSGGVDSAVAGMLLKENGYDLDAFYLILIDNDPNIKQAKRVAKFLKISLHEIDAIQEFRQKITNYFIKEYKEGRTPNPCIKCNRDIKFGMLFEKAMKMGFAKLATGHYVSIKQKNKKTKKQKKLYHLVEGRDKEKDQSYFLYNLNQEILSKVLFPLGNYDKADVKKMAENGGIPILKKESQDICFLPNGEIGDFLKDNLKSEEGDIVNIEGKKIGRHQGLFLYTIGQRRSIGIGGIGPFYVVKKDIKNNLLVVSKDGKDSLLYQKEIAVSDVHWISGIEPRLPLEIKARIRYRQRKENAVVENKTDNKYLVNFKVAQKAAALGQSVVFYKGKEVLGGGIICQ